MNANTLRFGIARAAVLSVLLVAAALYAGNAHADSPVAPQAKPAVTAALIVAAAPAAESITAPNPSEAPLIASAEAERAARAELLSKVAASALVAPRGFVLVMPAALAQPTL